MMSHSVRHLHSWSALVEVMAWPLSGHNSLAPGKFEWNFRYLILQIISVIDGWGISRERALRWMSTDFIDDKSTLDQVMAWCRQATSHYLSQCWPRSMSSYGITGPQWVKNCTMRNVLQLNWNQNINIFIKCFKEYAFESVVCKMATILFRPLVGWRF